MDLKFFPHDQQICTIKIEAATQHDITVLKLKYQLYKQFNGFMKWNKLTLVGYVVKDIYLLNGTKKPEGFPMEYSYLY